ncbi:E3 ubiquitin/ISG15 ligase TRIM25-like [Discoglossus pictus]
MERFKARLFQAVQNQSKLIQLNIDITHLNLVASCKFEVQSLSAQQANSDQDIIHGEAGKSDPFMMASQALREELKCSICLGIYTDPVMLSCGHNFCVNCIENLLDIQTESGTYTCPDCRKKYRKRPTLHSNLKLRNIAGHFISTTQAKDKEEVVVLCTYCVDYPEPASKSCLHCEVSLCKVHLRAHRDSADHILTQPTNLLEERKCSIHKELLRYYCTQDAALVCASCCLMGDHRGHEIELLNDVLGMKKENLRKLQINLALTRTKTKKRLQSLQQQNTKLQENTADITGRFTVLIKDLRNQLNNIEDQVLREITRQYQVASVELSSLIEQLKMKEDDLTREILHIKELCDITDPVYLLKLYKPKNDLITGAGNGEADNGHLNISCQLDELLINLTLEKNLEKFVSFIPDLISTKWSQQEYVSDLLLDVNMANNHISLSQDLKTVSYCVQEQIRHEEHEQFTTGQVLSITSFTSGQHYWEVEVSENGLRSIGVAYPSIVKKGPESSIGYNNKSWSLTWMNKLMGVSHNCECKTVSTTLPMKVLGVYLDYEAGILSFYKVCEPIRHLHTFTAKFTEPLHLAINVVNGWVTIKSKSYWANKHFPAVL